MDDGFTPIPLTPGKESPPLIDWKPYRTTRPTEEQVVQWFTDNPGANIGLVTGETSGFILLALGSLDAITGFAEQCVQGGTTLDTPFVRTPQGLHVYFRHPGEPVPARVTIGKGWEVVGDGQLVVAPGSVTNGVQYTFAYPIPPGAKLSELLAPMPGWVSAELRKERPKGRMFRPKRVGELLLEEPAPTPWVWNCYLPEGCLTILAAFPKTGKSTLVYPLALAVARGHPFLGYGTKQGAVLILSEEHQRDVMARLERFRVTADDPLHIYSDPFVLNDVGIPALEQFVRANHIRLVLIDPLAYFVPIKDENDNSDILRKIMPLHSLARRTGAAVLMLHHTRKNTDGSGGGRGIRGASSLLGLVDQGLTLEERHGGNRYQRVLRSIGRYNDTPGELIVELDMTAGEYRVVTTGSTKADGDDQAVLALLTNEPKIEEDLAKDSGLPPGRVREAVKRLCGNLNAIREGKGVKGSPYTYRLLPVGSYSLSSLGVETELNRNLSGDGSEFNPDYNPSLRGEDESESERVV